MIMEEVRNHAESALARLRGLEEEIEKTLSAATAGLTGFRGTIVEEIQQAVPALPEEQQALDAVSSAVWSGGPRSSDELTTELAAQAREATQKVTELGKAIADAQTSVDAGVTEFDRMLDGLAEEVTGQTTAAKGVLDALESRLTDTISHYDDQLKQVATTVGETIDTIEESVAGEVRAPIQQAIEEMSAMLTGLQSSTVVAVLNETKSRTVGGRAQLMAAWAEVRGQFDADVDELCKRLVGCEKSGAERNRAMGAVSGAVKDAFEDTIGRLGPVKKIAGIVGFRLG